MIGFFLFFIQTYLVFFSKPEDQAIATSGESNGKAM
jgi:hypothetical protein